MCGIAGFFSKTAFIESDTLVKMANQIRHRGPDDSGYWLDHDSGIGMSHRRLSIQDLSSAGHQPMESASGRYMLVFNGEIYNNLQIRKLLNDSISAIGKSNKHWRGHSDTETLLAGFDRWGITETLKQSVGMFAIAVWDRHDCILTLARDRFGEKPLYYGWNNRTFLFASELKALCAFPDFKRSINRNSISLLLKHTYIPAPHSIYEGIFKLLPGMTLTINLSSTAACPWDISAPPFEEYNSEGVNLSHYWALKTVVEQGSEAVFSGTEIDAIDELERLLVEAVKLQQISDVPLGAFLSGGIDSTTIVALMQAHSANKVKTFTIGFKEPGFNEAEHAKAIARRLGTEHTELYLTPEELRNVIPLLPTMYDEPFSDSSQIPTYMVCQLARKLVTVSLSGDAGDELFGGYNRYYLTNKILDCVGPLPYGIRKLTAGIINGMAGTLQVATGATFERMFPGIVRTGALADQLRKLAEVLPYANKEDLFYKVTSHWKNSVPGVKGVQEHNTLHKGQGEWLINTDFNAGMLYLDTMFYLPDDILVKVDRAAMAVSLETRIPLLDHRIVEFAWKLPFKYKVRENERKWILKQVLYRHVPREIMERPKKGFSVPISGWLRGPLREWAEEYLRKERLDREGIFHSEPVCRKLREHLSGIRDWHHDLWSLLMFQTWFENEKTYGNEYN